MIPATPNSPTPTKTKFLQAFPILQQPVHQSQSLLALLSTAISPIFTLHAVGVPRTRSLIGRSGIDFPGVPGWQFGFGETHVGAVAPERGFPAGTTVCAGNVIADSVYTNVSPVLVSGDEDEKTACVLYSYSKQSEDAQRRPTGQQAPARDVEHGNVCSGQKSGRLAEQAWKEREQQKIGE